MLAWGALSSSAPAGAPASLIHCAVGSPNAPVVSCSGQKIPSGAVASVNPVVRVSVTERATSNPRDAGGQSMLVMRLDVVVHALPVLSPSVHLPSMHFGHGE